MHVDGSPTLLPRGSPRTGLVTGSPATLIPTPAPPPSDSHGSNVSINAPKPLIQPKKTARLPDLPRNARPSASQSAAQTATVGQTPTPERNRGDHKPATNQGQVQEIDTSESSGEEEEVCALLPPGPRRRRLRPARWKF